MQTLTIEIAGVPVPITAQTRPDAIARAHVWLSQLNPTDLHLSLRRGQSIGAYLRFDGAGIVVSPQMWVVGELDHAGQGTPPQSFNTHQDALRAFGQLALADGDHWAKPNTIPALALALPGAGDDEGSQAAAVVLWIWDLVTRENRQRQELALLRQCVSTAQLHLNIGQVGPAREALELLACPAGEFTYGALPPDVRDTIEDVANLVVKPGNETALRGAVFSMLSTMGVGYLVSPKF